MSDIPCRVSADIRAHHAETNRAPNPAPYMDQAREELAERLRSGKTVGLLTLGDLIDSDLDGPRHDFAMMDVRAILLSEYPETPLLQNRYIEGVIERYLESKPDLVEEHAAYLAAPEE